MRHLEESEEKKKKKFANEKGEMERHSCELEEAGINY
jgi:hypothetical protein